MPRQKKSPEAIAQKIVRRLIEDIALDPSKWSEDEQFDALLEANLKELPEHFHKNVLTLDQECEMYERVKAALPEDLQEQLFTLNEWNNIEAQARMEVGYLVGLEMGRRLGGVR